jgi:2-methylcitrate dehydratase PrpD
MSAGSTVVVEGATRRLAEFIANVRFEDFPPRVVEGAKLQILSMLAAASAGHRTEAGRAVLSAFLEGAGLRGKRECAVIGTRERAGFRDALYLNAALSMTLDYDDYLFAGHTGHSAVLASLGAAETFGLSGRELLTLQVLANEIEGRIGASVLLGPLNGQLWSFIHAAGAAAVHARALGFEAEEIESALGIALLQPPTPLGRGFFGSEAKALLASMPAAHGIDAAELVRAGLAGARGILDGPQGFVAKFTPRPIAGAFTGLGSTWLTDTLCFKPYPGCAYIDSSSPGNGSVIGVSGSSRLGSRFGTIRSGPSACSGHRCWPSRGGALKTRRSISTGSTSRASRCHSERR